MRSKKEIAKEREELSRDIFFDGGQWIIEGMNTKLLRKYFTNWFFDPMKCNVDDWLFVEALIDNAKIELPRTHFYTMLWIVAYYQREFDEVFPREWYDVNEELEKEKREIKIKNLQNEFKKALDKKKLTDGYDQIIIKGNIGDKRKTNYKISGYNNKLSKISFKINGNTISIDDKEIIYDFEKLLINKVLSYEPKITGLKIPTKNQAIHTMAIEKLYPVYEMLSEKKMVNDNRAYKIIEQLLSYYEFGKVVGKENSISQIRNTLKNHSKK